MVNSINPLDYFEKSDLASTYDFNKDGVVDYKDYTDACLYISDEDTSNDINYTQAELDEIFADLIAKNDKNYKAEEITTENAVKMSQQIKTVIDAGLSPTQATSLNNLQVIGATLSKYIKQCASISTILAPIIKEQKEELDKLAEEKADREKEYQGKTEEVAQKTEMLDAKMQLALSESQRLTDEQRTKCTSIINTCVQNYISGRYPNQNLQDIITSKLASQGGFNTTGLKNILNQASSLGTEIKTLCSDIETIVSDIKGITEKYNAKKETCDINIEARNNALSAAKTASAEYQKGYQQRIDMRNAIIEKYKIDTPVQGDVAKSTNPQVQQLAEFLNNKELDNMPYTDAVAIVTAVFDNCAISVNPETGGWVIPKGHDSTAKNIFSAFAQSLKDNYGVDAKIVDEEYKDPTSSIPTTGSTGVTGITRNDPISFTDGNIKYEFINDRDKDGIFDDASEFLGAKDGWAEMKSFDTNGDGLVSGDELNNLKLVAIDNESGQFSFSSAAEAGITSIDLNSYKESNSMATNGDITAGTFTLSANGKTFEGQHTLDTDKNLDSKYSTLYGNNMENMDELSEKNPFMEEFQQTLNTVQTVEDANVNIKNNNAEANKIVENAKHEQTRTVAHAAFEGEAEKTMADNLKENKAKIEEKKQAEKEEAEKAKAEKEEAEKKEAEEEEKKKKS